MNPFLTEIGAVKQSKGTNYGIEVTEKKRAENSH